MLRWSAWKGSLTHWIQTLWWLMRAERRKLYVLQCHRHWKALVFQAGQGFLRSFSVWSRSIRSVCRKLLKDSLQRKAISIRSYLTLPASLIISWQLRKWRNIWLWVQKYTGFIWNMCHQRIFSPILSTRSLLTQRAISGFITLTDVALHKCSFWTCWKLQV